ncbi:hypothetical protein Micbo1qcDRAFT_180565 [Microdochium bolleyi]|uniref:F-box domain-containing protein n=1 Tax=Microdochium bolleyi TaxID=196109 RepID=A0A136IL55_9PEZI|nr:hypothetical protein Micbo1qcDRAFT_180565 [Microdochium bolleyi]
MDAALPFRLLSLPSELRLIIYEYAVHYFIQGTAEPLEVAEYISDLATAPGPRQQQETPALARSCKAVARELTPMLGHHMTIRPRERPWDGLRTIDFGGARIYTACPLQALRGLRHVRVEWQLYEPGLPLWTLFPLDIAGIIPPLFDHARESIRTVHIVLDVFAHEGRRWSLSRPPPLSPPPRLLPPLLHQPWQPLHEIGLYALEFDMAHVVRYFLGLPALRRIGFTGMFRQRWLDHVLEPARPWLDVRRGREFCSRRAAPGIVFDAWMRPPERLAPVVYELCE